MHREDVLGSTVCGCFYCCAEFEPGEIHEWVDADEQGLGQTALCPRCGIDAVIDLVRAEASYHLRYSGGWLERLGDGTAESHERAQRALEKLWPFVNELFADDDVDREVAEARIAPLPSSLEKAWSARVDAVLAAATLARPAPVPFPWFGKQGRHSEHLGYLLAEMQSLHRAHPGATW